MSKLLVTGGAGFIGSHIVDALIARGDEVVVLDNISTGKRENVNAQASLVEADITQFNEIKSHFAGVEHVFHCAALPRVQLSIDDPVSTHEANINGTLNVLLAAREAGVKRLVYSASSSAIGSTAELPTKETFLPQPISPYALQKYVGEHYCRLFSLLYDLETVSLRYFNVYGPRMAFTGAYTTVIATFLQQKKEGKKLTITGDGTQTRDFTFIDDVVRANLAAAKSEKAGQGEVINVGAHDNHSVNEVAEIIGGDAEHIAPRIEPHDSLADISRAQALLNWTPEVSFDQGLKQTIAWFESL